MSSCDTCNLRCSVKYPGKKVPISPSTCPNYKDGNKQESAMKRMPMLRRFNEICAEHGIGIVIWR